MGGAAGGGGPAQGAGLSRMDELYQKVLGGGEPTGPSLDDLWSRQSSGTWQRSLDGDTADLSRAKLRRSTRFAGIDAPESAQGELGAAAQKALDDLVGANRDIRVLSQERDKYGRDVSLLEAGGKNLNVELVRGGHAKVYRDYLGKLSKPMQDQLLAAEEEAKAAKRGVWGDPNYQDAADFRKEHQGHMAEGHDMRAPIDSDTLTMDQLYRRAFGSQGDPLARPARSDGPAIAAEDRVAPAEGWLDRVLGGLDYAGNVSRSTLRGAVEGAGKGPGGALQSALAYGRQALNRDRQTTAARLKDSVTEKLGLGKLRAGRDDGRFQVGDLADVATDVGIDVATDPLTWVTAGFSSIGKGGKLAQKLLPGLVEGAADAKASLPTAAAATWNAAKTAGRAATGAVYGAGMTDPDSDLLTKSLAAAGGAAVGVAAGPALEAGGTAARSFFNKVSDRYATATRGTKFANFAEARDTAINAYDKVKEIGEWIRQGRQDALDGLDAAGRVRATELMGDLKSEFLRRRNLAAEKIGLDKVAEGSREWNVAANRLDRGITSSIEEDYLPSLLAKERDDVSKAVVDWGKHNEAVTARLNRERFGLPGGDPDVKTGKGIVGLKWHTDDVFEMANPKQVDELVADTGKLHRAESEARQATAVDIATKNFEREQGWRAMGAVQDGTAAPAVAAKWNKYLADAQDKTYGAYTEKFAKTFLDDAERKATTLMREYAETPAKQGVVRAGEKLLDGFDKMTTFMKVNMLMFSTSWVKNNYFDNLAKAFVENGVHGLFDAATMGKFRKGVYEDVRDMYKGSLNRKYASPDTREALERGVLDNPMFKSLSDDDTRALLYSPEEVKKQSRKTVLGALAGAVTENPFNQAVSKLGTNMEGTARMMTYLHTRDALMRLPKFRDGGEAMAQTAKDIAADVVKKTFFDYGDVTHLEAATLKRLMPFYSFYSKNLPYWLKATVDPERAGRALALEKVREGIGSAPTAQDKRGMSPYIADNAPRKLGTDERGRKVYMISPSTSSHDAYAMLNPKGWLDQVVDKANPLLKTGYELASGNDLFDGGPLLPSQDPSGKKFLFSRGHKYGFLPQLEVDHGGNPYTRSDALVLFDKLASTLVPHGAIDQLAGSAGKIGTGKESFDEAVFNRLSPSSKVKVSPGYENMVRMRKGEAARRGED